MSLSSADALQTIRRAYEYVEQYQQRLLDALAMIEGRLVGFVPICWSSGSTWHRGRLPAYAGDHLLRNVEVSWAHGAQHEEGEGTYVIVTHVADTSVTGSSREGSAAAEADTILRGVVVRPRGAFEAKAFERPDWWCIRHQFPADTNDLESLRPGPPRAKASNEGSWYVHVLSLAAISAPDDFTTIFADPLAARANELSRGLSEPTTPGQ